MKKKGLAAVLAAVMLISTVSVPVYARYDVADTTDSQYTFRDTEDLQIDIDAGNGDAIVLTWPAVDKEGNIIKANPLKADGQTNSNGNPTRGWTNPTSGMIIEYDGWQPDGESNSVKNDNKSDHNVLMGIVDTPTEYPIYVKDPLVDTVTTGTAVKAAYIDTTVVATSFATAYQVQYSLDGEKWIDDSTTSFNHGKKLTRIRDVEAVDPDTGEITITQQLKDDNKNTFFLEDQITTPLTASLLPETTYYIRVVAYDASKPATKNTPFRIFQSTVTTPAKAELTPAFPSVEGGGTYSQGGRGGDVYVVTNLTDSVSDPQPGSLRYGLLRKDRADGNALAPRTIVFAVGGTIHIDESAPKASRRMNVTSNTTLLGQTAPGEGITIAGSSMKFSGENIIVRYMRFRLGGGYDLDAATASGKYIVIDHCSFGWGVDEVFSAKEILNSSIQYNIISSGLAMPDKNGVLNSEPEIGSGESEAKHGMGSILNGYEVSYTHNLWAHNGTRNPRFEGGFDYNGIRYENKIDYANNVVYDWGHNSTYGGERGTGQMNFVGNYYKPGPETLEKVKYQFFDCDASGTYKGSYYIADNVITSSESATANNEEGFNGTYTKLTAPVELAVPYEATSAEEAFNAVYTSAGASLHRDPQDQRLALELIRGTGSFVNSEAEAGGWDNETFTSDITDTDNDGLPDEFEIKHGLNPNDASDSCTLIEDEESNFNGYSWIEVYAGILVGEWYDGVIAVTSEQVVPHSVITAITDENGNNVMAEKGNTILLSGDKYTITLDEPVKSKVYLNDILVADGEYTFTPQDTGIYNLACLMEADSGRNYTPAVPVTVVKGTDNLEGFTSADIGGVGAAGADNYDVQTGTLYSQGAGRIGYTNTSGEQKPDAFHYNYQQVSGDFEFTAKIDNIAKIDYFQKTGLMVRASLDPSAEFYMAALTYLKGEDFEGLTDISGESIKAKNLTAMARTADGAAVEQIIAKGGRTNTLGVAITRADVQPNHGYGRIIREGNTVTVSASTDGNTWYTLRVFENVTLPDVCYIGFATSAAQDTSDKVRYNATAFSDITVNANAVEGLWGDANCDGMVTANDAALTLQFVLTNDKSLMPAQGINNIMVIDADTLTANNAALILQKALNNEYKFPVEG